MIVVVCTGERSELWTECTRICLGMCDPFLAGVPSGSQVFRLSNCRGVLVFPWPG